MSRPKGLKIDLIGSPESTHEAIDMGVPGMNENYDPNCGAYQVRSKNDLNDGIVETNGIPLRRNIDTEVGLQHPVLDDAHPCEFLVNTNTRGGSDPTRR